MTKVNIYWMKETISIISLLLEGMILKVGDDKFVIGEDGRIGYLRTNLETKEESVLGDLTFRELYNLIKEKEIFLIPKRSKDK